MIYLPFQMSPKLSLLKPLKILLTPTTTKVQSLIRIMMTMGLEHPVGNGSIGWHSNLFLKKPMMNGFFTCLMRQVMRMKTMFRQENQKTEKSKQKTLQKPRKKKVLTYPVTYLTLYPSKVQF